MAARLKMSGIESIYDLAHADPYILKQRFGVMGLQLYANSWGIDRIFLGEKRQVAKEKSFGNSQVLPRDYARRDHSAEGTFRPGSNQIEECKLSN
ncbi:DNA polymerase V [Enterococcus sp. DIV0564]